MPQWPRFQLGGTSANAESTTPPPPSGSHPPHPPIRSVSDQHTMQRSRPVGQAGPDVPRSTPPMPPTSAYNTMPTYSSSPPKSNQHGRSTSQTLPTLFNGGRKNLSAQDTRGAPQYSAPDVFPGETMSPRRRGTTSKKTEDGDTTTGRCATCGTKMNWPNGVMQFRCGACIMVNDLTSINARQDGISGTMISIEETRAIIDRCIRSYLQTQQRPIGSAANGPSTGGGRSQQYAPAQPRGPGPIQGQPPQLKQLSFSSRSPPMRQPGQPTNGLTPTQMGTRPGAPPLSHAQTFPLQKPAPDDRPLPGPPVGLAPNGQTLISPRRAGPGPMQLPVRSTSMNQSIPTPSPQPMQTPRLDAESPFDDTGQDYFASKTIFKPLEDYIIRTFGSYECLNRAFVSGRLRLRPTTSNTSNTNRAASSTSRPSYTQLGDAQISELDAKTLLLGNLGENALWWTGEEENLEASKTRPVPSPVHQNDLVNSKSPRINWEEVTAWYKMVLLVGVDWQEYLSQNSMLANRSDITVAFAEARVHVQRTVLKASESLLRRPGRPLNEPSDARFLLISLANPLLYPTIVSPLATQIAEANPLPSIHENDTSMSPGRRKVAGVWEQGNAFGNVKRILGLLSNLSNECHRCLLAWFTRYSETQFKELIGLIQAFVNHRLDRQHGRKRSNSHPTPAPTSMIPGLGDTSAATSAVLHSALGLKPQQKPILPDEKFAAYCDDWQIKSAARLMSLLFSANKQFHGERTSPLDKQDQDPGSISRRNIKHQGQLLSTSDFYNLVVDRADMIADFETWEHAREKFAFCQYPFFLSVGSKIRIMEHDARRQMELQEREAFFDSIIRNRVTDRYCLLKVRRDCLADDSMKSISGAVGQGQGEIKKGLRVHFIGEEGVDAGGLRKEWFLLLAKEIFDPQYGLFVYDEDSHFCYFNPNSLETSDVYFLVGALIGLAIYNSAILDIALPPFVFKKLLATGPTSANTPQTHRAPPQCTLDDLTELRPSLARGLRRLLEYDGDVTDLGLDFVAEVDNYDRKEQIPLSSDGRIRPVTNANRQEFVNLYVRYLLDTSVNKQFEPFKRGFFTVCGGNALSLFQPEEIELLVRGSDEKLDVQALKAVAVYDNWRRGKEEVADPLKEVNLIQWFWAFFEEVDPASQRRILSFITGSDRIPAMGAASLIIKIQFAGKDYRRYPVARTCFNLIMLYKYRTKDELAVKIWRAVTESEGFGLK